MGKHEAEASNRPRRTRSRSTRKDRNNNNHTSTAATPHPDEPDAASLLLQSTSPRGGDDGHANGAPSAVSSSPLLVRPDDDDHQSGGSSPRTKNRRKHLKKARGTRHKSEPQDTIAGAIDHGAHSGSVDRQDTMTTTTTTNHMSRAMVVPSMLGRLAGSCCCLGLGGSFRSPASRTELPQLSAQAQAKLQSLDAVAGKSQVGVVVHHTDNLPFRSASSSSRGEVARPVVVMHLLDLCSGQPLAAAHTTERGTFSTRLVHAFEWNASHLWTGVPWKSFLAPHVAILIELVMAPPPRKAVASTNEPVRHRHKPQTTNLAVTSQCKRLAWSFFKPVSDQGNIRLTSLDPCAGSSKEDLDPTMRLQLYAWQPLSWLETHQARSQFLDWHPAASSSMDSGAIPTVFLQYQRRKRTKLPCSLHVEIYPVVPLSSALQEAPAPSQEQLPVIDEGDNQVPPSQTQDQAEDTVVDAGATKKQTSANQEPQEPQVAPQMSPLDPLLRCKRDINEPCLVPQRVLHRLPTGRKGCSCVAFSPDGVFLAAAVHQLTTASEEWVIQIYQINSGLVWQSCRGHQSMIYSLTWKTNPDAGGIQWLVSASSDGSAVLWRLRATMLPGSRGSGSGALAMLPHQVWQHVPSPTFVYCAIFHAMEPDLVVTGASDGIVRYWNIRPVIAPAATTNDGTGSCYSFSPIRQWTAAYPTSGSRVGTAIHSMCMDPKTGRLFCGDASGCITVWDTARSHELLKTIRTGQRSITSLQLHPRKQHLLVMTHPHALLHYELRSFLLLHKNYVGIECDQLLVKATFSADGQFVVCGSEDGVPHLFGSVLGQRFDGDNGRAGVWGQRFFHGYPVLEIAWSPTSHIVAIGAYGENHPVVVLGAFREDRILMDNSGIQHGALERRPHRSRAIQDKKHDFPDPGAGTLGASVVVVAAESGKSSRVDNSDAARATTTEDSVASDRLQRSRERRQQRLQAKIAREVEETESPSTTTMTISPPLSSIASN